MAHRYKHADVVRALERYRSLTGDRAARLETEQTTNAQGVRSLVYRVADSTGLRGFEAYGGYSAYSALEMYCNGFEDGRRAAVAQEAGNAS